MPRYECAGCGHNWARGGAMRDCPRCGECGPHNCCQLGWSGVTSGLLVCALGDNPAPPVMGYDDRDVTAN